MAKRKRGGQSTYSPEAATFICNRLAEGKSLREACRQKGMPSEASVRRWVIDDVSGFAAHYARARDVGLDAMADKAMEIAARAVRGTKTVKKPSGTEVTTADAVERAKLHVDTIKWYLSKLAPKKYGDRLQHGFEEGATLRLEFGRRDVVLHPAGGAQAIGAQSGSILRHTVEHQGSEVQSLPTIQPLRRASE